MHSKKDQKVTKYDSVVSLYLSGKSFNEIAEIAELHPSTVRKYVARARIDNLSSLRQKNDKIKKLSVIQDDILDELLCRDHSLEESSKLSQTLKTAHTLQRDEEGKNTDSLEVFFDLLRARNDNKSITIEAEFREIDDCINMQPPDSFSFL